MNPGLQCWSPTLFPCKTYCNWQNRYINVTSRGKDCIYTPTGTGAVNAQYQFMRCLLDQFTASQMKSDCIILHAK